MIRKEDVKPGVIVRIDRVECRNLLPGSLDRRTIALDAYAEFNGGRVTQLLLGETLEILSPPRKLDGINLVQVRSMTGDVGEVYYMDIHHCCTLASDKIQQPRKPERSETTIWDHLAGDDE